MSTRTVILILVLTFAAVTASALTGVKVQEGHYSWEVTP